jgi:hypothetical protein
VAADWRNDRIGSAHRGENPLVMARMRSGFTVIGDTQHLPGDSLLLTDDPSVNHLTDPEALARLFLVSRDAMWIALKDARLVTKIS